ncbi:MAG TPA: biotin/lipoyl-containing protein [Ktedonobacterales bacterium]
MEPDKGSGTGRETGHEVRSGRETGHEAGSGHSSGHGSGQIARRNGALHSAPRVRLSVAELRQLIRMMSTSDIAEITLEHPTGGLHLTLKKPAPIVLAPAAVAPAGIDLEEAEMSQSAEVEEVPASKPELPLVEVRSPLVGIFRSSMKEHGKPLVHAEETVRQGQVVAAIEALNVFNEVEVPTAGQVKKVLVTDGQPVEYGQPLLLIEPKVAR